MSKDKTKKEPSKTRDREKEKYESDKQNRSQRHAGNKATRARKKAKAHKSGNVKTAKSSKISLPTEKNRMNEVKSQLDTIELKDGELEISEPNREHNEGSPSTSTEVSEETESRETVDVEYPDHDISNVEELDTEERGLEIQESTVSEEIGDTPSDTEELEPLSKQLRSSEALPVEDEQNEEIVAKEEPSQEMTQSEQETITRDVEEGSEKQAVKKNEPISPSERGDVIYLDLESSQPRSPLGKQLGKRAKEGHQKLDIEKKLLPGEKHLSAKLLIYFDEIQIFLGILLILLSIPAFILTNLGLLSIIMVLSGVLVIITGYASEEIHVTSLRVMVRRMNWVDRFFKIPRDSQYILHEIVSFDVQRAPPNKVLLYFSLVPPIFLLFPIARTPLIIASLVIIAVALLVLSQRLTKRTLTFSLSGGHVIHLGAEKGLPFRMIDEFTKIVMEFNVYQSDSY